MKHHLIVGSDDLSDIVVDHATISRRHCELRWSDGAWRINDLESTNGTFVNNDRITAPRVLNENDHVTLGRGYVLAIPDAPTKPVATIDRSLLPSPVSTKPIDKQARPSGFIWTIASVVSIGILVMGYMFTPSGRSPLPEKDSTSVSEISSSATNNDSVIDKRPNAATPLETAVNTNTIAMPEGSISSKIDSPYWAVTIEDKGGSESRLIGTAIAVEENRLLTLASIIDAAAEVKSKYPTLSLRHASSSTQQIMPIETVMHPGYIAAKKELSQFEEALNARIEKADTQTDPSLEESLDWSAKLEAILQKIASHDLATIKVVDSLPSVLKVISTELKPGSIGYRLVGFPMATPSPSIHGNLHAFFLEQKGELRLDRKTQNPAKVFESAIGLSGLKMVSMACLDTDSNLVGVCVHQAPTDSNASLQHCQITKPEAFWK